MGVYIGVPLFRETTIYIDLLSTASKKNLIQVMACAVKFVEAVVSFFEVVTSLNWLIQGKL